MAHSKSLGFSIIIIPQGPSLMAQTKLNCPIKHILSTI